MSNDSIIEQIRELWRLATPVKSIADRLHLPDSTVRHVLEFVAWPEQHPLWKQPAPNHISDR